MANLSQIKLPNGTTYNIKDSISGYTTNIGTITRVKTTAGAHTTIDVSSGAATFNVPTKTSHLTNDSGFLTAHQTLYEANLNWGGKDFSAGYSPIDAAMIDVLGANRFAFLRAAGLTIEYSTDGGSSYTDYGATDAQKVGLFSSGQSFYLGKHTSNGSCTTNDRLRVTIDTGAANIYTVLNKIAIYISTSGATVQVLIEKALQSTPTTFSIHKDWTGISGWSGWNILNISGLTTYGNTPASQYGRIRFTFRQTVVNTTYSSANISKIMGFGGVGWAVPSTMAATGHLYSYDSSQNATFPAKVTATSFSGPLTGNVTGNVSGTAANVTGTIAIANGGTGQTTAANAINALLNGLPVWTADPTDTTYFVRQDTGGSATYGKVAFSTIWNYISGKLPAWSKASTKPSYNFSEIGSTPTTLSGYGITDAKIASGTITLGSNTITPLTASSTLDATKLSGTIPSSCYTDSDEKVKSVVNTDSATCYLLTTTKSTENTGTAVKHTTAKVQFSADSSTNGYTILLLGNNISKDTAGAKYGVVRLYGNSTYYTDLQVINASTANRTIRLPDANGTLVLTDNLPTISLNGSTTTSPSFYAPTTAGTNGYVLKSNGSGAPTWTSATLTDEKVQTIAASNNTTYYLMLADGVNTKTRQIDSIGNGLKYNFTQGTTTTVGTATLLLGNLIASGNDYNTKGILRLYGTNAHWIDLISGTPTTTRTITLPDDTGTLALNKVATTSASGLMSNTDKIYLDGLSDAIETTSSTITIKNGSSGGRAFYLETNSSDTDDTSLISAITSLGWDSDVIVS